MTDPRTAFAAWVRRVMGDVTYHSLYPARVERDNGDGTVDVLADDEAIRGIGLQQVPSLTGIAGALGRVNLGTRCLLGFADADPRRPVIVAWEYQQGSAVVSLDGGTAPVATFGSIVDVKVDPAMLVCGMAAGIQKVPNGVPPHIPPILDVPFGPSAPFSGVAVVAVPVQAVVQSGAPKVLA